MQGLPPWRSTTPPTFPSPNPPSQERQRLAEQASAEEPANAQDLLPGTDTTVGSVERSSEVIMEGHAGGNLEAAIEGHLVPVPDADVDHEIANPQQYEEFQDSSENSGSAIDDVLRRHSLRRVLSTEAAQNRDYIAIRSLVDRGAYLNVEGYNQGTPLSLASRDGRLEAVRQLLEQGEDVDHQDLTGWTPLHEASAQGHHDVVQLLLENDADIDAQTTSLWTPLHIASLKGELVVLLLAHEADVLARNNDDQTFLDVAWENRHTEMFDVDSLYTDDLTVLHIAVQHGDPKFMRWLIGHGAKVDAEDKNMETPLFPASRNGRLEATQLLLEHHAEVDHRNWKKRTPLHGALGNGHHDVAMLLLKHDADVNAQNVYNWTPLHLASQTGMYILTKELVERGAKVNARNDFGWTPLHMASQKGHVEVVKVLLVSDADVKIRNEDGETALHLSAYYGKLGVVEALLKRDADLLCIPNKEGKTPLDLASVEGHKDIAQALRREVEKPVAIGSETDSHTTPGSTRSNHRSSKATPEYTVPKGRQRRQPAPPPPPEFPEPFPTSISRQRSNFAYRLPGPQPGNNQQIPSPSAYYTQPNTSYQQSEPVPPPVRLSTHPRTSQPPPPVRQSTHPAPAPTRQLAPIYENASRTPPSAPQSLSRSSSHNPTFPISLRQESHAFTASSGSLPPIMQRSTSIPIPSDPRTALSFPYYDLLPPYYDSSPPYTTPAMSLRGSSSSSSAYPPSRSETPGEPLPMELSWSYFDLHEREDVSSDENEEPESPERPSDSGGYMRERGPPSRSHARRQPRRTRRLGETVAASTSQPPPPRRGLMSGGPQPINQSRRYPDVHEREGVSVHEDLERMSIGTSNSSGYIQEWGLLGAPYPQYAGRRPPNRGGTAPESEPAGPTCRLCGSLVARREVERLGGFCTERHRWEWERNHSRR